MEPSLETLALSEKVYAPLNQCAYCGSTDNLSNEHIIPLGLGGKLILPRGSCRAHATLTSKVEDFVLRKYLGPLRSHLSLPSRRPHSRPDGYPLSLMNGARIWRQKVKLSDHPGLVRFLMFAAPGRVAGRPRVQDTYDVQGIDVKIFPDIDQRLARLGATSFRDAAHFKATALARMIAKIGHAFAVAEKGVAAFEEMYVTHLIDADAPDWNYWVGGYDWGHDLEDIDNLHRMHFLHRGRELSVIVHLFVRYCPRFAYEVIVGRLRS